MSGYILIWSYRDRSTKNDIMSKKVTKNSIKTEKHWFLNKFHCKAVCSKYPLHTLKREEESFEWPLNNMAGEHGGGHVEWERLSKLWEWYPRCEAQFVSYLQDNQSLLLDA